MLTWFDPIRVPNSKTNVKFFPIIFFNRIIRPSLQQIYNWFQSTVLGQRGNHGQPVACSADLRATGYESGTAQILSHNLGAETVLEKTKNEARVKPLNPVLYIAIGRSGAVGVHAQSRVATLAMVLWHAVAMLQWRQIMVEDSALVTRWRWQLAYMKTWPVWRKKRLKMQSIIVQVSVSQPF